LSAKIIDIDSLLNAVPGDNPAGIDLRADPSQTSTFRQIKDARQKARQLEKRAEEDGQKSVESIELWRLIRDKGLDVLRRESKDLEIVASLIEALLRLDGFAGLHEGVRTARELVERFWDHVYPRPDDEGKETTVLPLIRLDGEVLAGAVRRVPITEAKGQGPFLLWQYKQAEALEGKSVQERQTQIDRGAVTKDMFESTARETSPEFFRSNFLALVGCRDELNGLAEAVNQRFPEAHAAYPSVLEAVEEGLSAFRLIAGRHLQEASLPGGQGNPANSSGGPGGGVHSNSQNLRNLVDIEVNTREDALTCMENVAAFFERTEPQSLIPALLRKVIRWGRLAPADFYAELIDDDIVRERVFKLVGIVHSKDDAASS
jgi:type VI secretion system protein ImpA